MNTENKRTKVELLMFENKISKNQLSREIEKYFDPSIHPSHLRKILNGEKDSMKSSYIRICAGLSSILGRVVSPNEVMEWEDEVNDVLKYKNSENI